MLVGAISVLSVFGIVAGFPDGPPKCESIPHPNFHGKSSDSTMLNLDVTVTPIEGEPRLFNVTLQRMDDAPIKGLVIKPKAGTFGEFARWSRNFQAKENEEGDANWCVTHKNERTKKQPVMFVFRSKNGPPEFEGFIIRKRREWWAFPVVQE